mgnify:FL=1
MTHKPSSKKNKSGTFFYGIHAVKAILENRPEDALTLFVQIAHDNQQKSHDEIVGLAKNMGVAIQNTQKDKLTELCASNQHQGVVLSARPKATLTDEHLEAYLKQDNVLFLILDQITDPHNLGACLRTAAALGVSAVIIPRHQSVGLSPVVAKVSVGGSEAIDVITVTNLARTLSILKDAGVFIFGTALDETAKPLYHCDLTGKVAIVMGSEGDGMRRLTREHCDVLVYIPMSDNPHRPQSLNVSVATGMVLYEAMRQRQS